MSIENIVRTIFAEELETAPENIRPETILRVGEIKMRTLRHVAFRIAATFKFPFNARGRDFETWTSVADAIEWAEKRIPARRAA